MHYPFQHSGRFLAASLILVLLTPAAEAAPLQQAQAQRDQTTAAPVPPPASPAPVDTPSQAATAQAELALPDNPSPQQTPQSGSQTSSQTGSQSPQPAPEQQNGNQKPLGTAAAPYEKTTGVAASRPAGAVIAPAKQRRVRTIWISVAAVVGAGIAVGTVVGLSKASSSRP